MGQYSALSDDFIIIAVSKAIVNSKTEKVEKYHRISRAVIGGPMPAPARKGAYFLILVSRVLALGEGEGPANVDGKDGTHSSSPDYTAPPGQKMRCFYE